MVIAVISAIGLFLGIAIFVLGVFTFMEGLDYGDEGILLGPLLMVAGVGIAAAVSDSIVKGPDSNTSNSTPVKVRHVNPVNRRYSRTIICKEIGGKLIPVDTLYNSVN